MDNHPVARWLLASNVKGLPALMLIVSAIVVPTIVRAAVNDYVMGCEFTPFLPFVLLTAMVLGWWQASLVTLASIAIVGGLFAGPIHHFFDEQCSVSATGVFLGASALIMLVVALAKQIFIRSKSRVADESAGGIVFSLEQDQVWASWYGSGPPMRLGSRNRVGAMMKDFLAQEELADRLTRKYDPPS